MRIVLSLFLPLQVQQEQEQVESTIYAMDSNRDGEISYNDFVKGVRDSDSFKISRFVIKVLQFLRSNFVQGTERRSSCSV